MAAPSCSLIVSTYNRPDALGICLESIFGQVQEPDEIIIADDGSGAETAQLIERMRTLTRVPLIHVWQEDEGYQLARIRNKSFAAASSEYLIQIDGDLVLEKHFVQDHLELARRGTFISGSRTMMNEALTRAVLNGEVRIEELPRHRSAMEKFHNARRSGLLRRISYLFERHPKKYKYVLGCNMAFWKSDLLKVNGYNESFRGWGKEDNELAVRLQQNGTQLRFIKFGAVVYHLHHKVADLSAVPANEEKLNETIRQKISYAPVGLDSYLNEKKEVL